MIGFKGIKSVLFGYAKKDVINYIDLLNEDLNSRLKEKDQQIKEVIEQNNLLFKRLEHLENSHEDISYAIIHAKKSAENIINDAEEQAEKILLSIKEKHKSQEEQYEGFKDEVQAYKNQIAQILKGFAEEAEKIKKECDEVYDISCKRRKDE